MWATKNGRSGSAHQGIRYILRYYNLLKLIGQISVVVLRILIHEFDEQNL
jgi:hypothetical protein